MIVVFADPSISADSHIFARKRLAWPHAYVHTQQHPLMNMSGPDESCLVLSKRRGAVCHAAL